MSDRHFNHHLVKEVVVMITHLRQLRLSQKCYVHQYGVLRGRGGK